MDCPPPAPAIELPDLSPEDWERAQKALEILSYADGDLRFILRDGPQKEIWDLYHDTEGDPTARILPILAARRTGKSLTALAIANGNLIRRPNSRWFVVAANIKQAVQIVMENLEILVSKGPPSMRPTRFKQENLWVYPNGSQFRCYGADEHADRMRGMAAHGVVVEEARDIRNFDYLVKDVLLPMCRTPGFNGRILCPTTTPDTPDHEVVPYIHKAEAAGHLRTYTIYDSTIPDHEIREIEEDSGGVESTTFRREWLCELIVNEETAVLPEFTEHQYALVPREEDWPDRPKHFDAYVSADIGWTDATHVLFGYYDFLGALVVVEDEIVLMKPVADELAAAVEAKETELWGGRAYLRIGDVNHGQLRRELHDRGMDFVAPPKLRKTGGRMAQKEGSVNALRLRLKQHEILIHPRCRELIAQCRGALWKRAGDHGRDTFARGRTSDGKPHHNDGVDALIYLDRGVIRTRNPYPGVMAGVDFSKQQVQRAPEDSQDKAAFAAAFSRRGKRARRR